MKIAITYGDGLIGWPTSLSLSHPGHEAHILDGRSHRRIDMELDVQSLTPTDGIADITTIYA